jgi:uncharacterized membrane protein
MTDMPPGPPDPPSETPPSPPSPPAATPPQPQSAYEPRSAHVPPAAAPSMLNDSRQMALIVYILYIVPAGGLTHLIGLILAYVSRDAAPDWLKSHYTLQIRTFWMGLLYFAASIMLCFVLIGFPLLLAAFIWFYVRCILGLIRLTNNEPYPNPQTWVI